LGVRFAKIFASRLVLDEQATWPEQVNEAPVAREFLNWFLKGGDGAATDAEDIEEVVPEGLAFGGFAGLAFPIFAEGDGVGCRPECWNGAS